MKHDRLPRQALDRRTCIRKAGTQRRTFPLRRGEASRVDPMGAKNASLLRHFILKCIILPRQARDKHRENTQKKGCVFAGGLEAQTATLLALYIEQVRKMTHFYVKTINLPRQAWDKRRKSCKKERCCVVL